MYIEVNQKPNSLGTHRYDVRAAGRWTHGFRRTVGEAQQAAREDGQLLYLCGRAEREDAPEAVAKPLPRRLRTGKNGGSE